MLVLGIESTCDETGASVVEDGKKILSNVIASSADIHEKYGGVFPELASRRHIDAIIPVIDEAIKKAGITPNELDCIAVAKGPGLIGSLLIGINAAKGLSIAWNKPLVGINHVEAHLYASMMPLDEIPLPALGVVISGGHTLILKILSVGKYEEISSTIDDAIGEAFDKVANLLHLPYPGGPQIEKLAKIGRDDSVPLKAGFVKKNPLSFSFSGLKTAVLYAAEKKIYRNEDLAASFQRVAFQDVIEKIGLAKKTFEPKVIFFGGGVSANEKLREMAKNSLDLPAFWPEKHLALDNAAMIAGLGAKKFEMGASSWDVEPQVRIPITLV